MLELGGKHLESQRAVKRKSDFSVVTGSRSTDTAEMIYESVDEWLGKINSTEIDKVVDYKFPSDALREEYIDTIGRRTFEEVNSLLLKFIIPSGSLGIDELRFRFYQAAQNEGWDMFQRMRERQYYRRLILHQAGHPEVKPWEGVTWILDLLPHFPREAIAALQSYHLAHAQVLPDGRYEGLLDAISIIRAKYIGSPETRNDKRQLLTRLSARDFEHVVERLYAAMGFATELTPASKDGGRDVIAHRNEPSRQLSALVECKRYEGTVGVAIARELLGVVSDEKVNKGVIVATSKFTKPAKDFSDRNPRIEFVDGHDLIRLMNEHFGPRWPSRIDSIISESRKQTTSS